MKNIKSLINLIKTSTKAQIVTGAVAVAVVGTVGVGGYAVYNNNQKGNSSTSNTGLIQEKKVSVKELINMLNEKKEIANKLLNNADLDDINTMIEEIEMKINTLTVENTDEMYKKSG